MKLPQLLFVLVSVCVFSLTANAEELTQGQQDFKAANERLLKGDAPGALTLYEHLSRQGVVHADLYYNLGNTYATLNRPIDAIVAYERSLLLDPGSESTQYNLSQIRKNLDPRYEQTSAEPIPAEPLDTIRSLVGPLSANLFAWLLLVANAGFFTCLLFLRYGRSAAIRRYAMVLIGASTVCIIFCGSVTLGHYGLAQDKLAVTEKKSDLKTGPNQRFDASDRTPAGARVRILDHQGDWSEVKTRLGTTGWILSTKIIPL